MEEKTFFNADQIKSTLMRQFPMGYRNKIEVAAGGILPPRTMANRDNNKEKEGIHGAVKIGGKVCYPN